MNQTDRLSVQDILNMAWVEASPPLTDSGMVISGPARPLHQPVRIAQPVRMPPPGVIIRPPMPRGMISYIASLVGNRGSVLEPTSVELLQQFGNVYLCAFVRVSAGDPVLPIVGLHWPWPPGVIDSSHPAACRMRYGYQEMTSLLERIRPTNAAWRRDMAKAVNMLLDTFSTAKSGVTDGEYTYIEKHLLGAASDPYKYTRQKNGS